MGTADCGSRCVRAGAAAAAAAAACEEGLDSELVGVHDEDGEREESGAEDEEGEVAAGERGAGSRKAQLLVQGRRHGDG